MAEGILVGQTSECQTLGNSKLKKVRQVKNSKFKSQNTQLVLRRTLLAFAFVKGYGGQAEERLYPQISQITQIVLLMTTREFFASRGAFLVLMV